MTAREAAEEAERAGYATGVKFGQAIGGAEEAMKTLEGLTAGAMPRILRTNPKFLEELQSGLAAKLNAIPDFPQYSDPKLAEIAQKGFDRGYKGGVKDARVKAALVNAGAAAALALSGEAAVALEKAGAKALSAAAARLRGMPVFVPVSAGGGGVFLRMPKPAAAATGARAAGEEATAAARSAGEAKAGASAETPAPKGGANAATRAAASRGSTLHADRPGNLPEQLRLRYPDTKFEFTKPGVVGQDVKVIGGKHPSEYPGSAWPRGVNRADFKPGTPSGARTFANDQAKKWPDPTVMVPYDPQTGKLNDDKCCAICWCQHHAPRGLG